MISQTAEYALRAVAVLADNQDTPLTTEKIADLTKVPVGYLAKIMQQLNKGGLVTSQRGLHGGFKLKVEPKALTMYDVVQLVDPFGHIDSCPLGIEDHRSLCPLHRRLDNALRALEKQLKGATFERLLHEPGQNKPLCSSAAKKLAEQKAK